MASRLLSDLDPRLEPIARQHISKALLIGIDLLVICTYRSMDEQANLYAFGRTKPGNPCRCGGKVNPIGACKAHPMGLVVTWAKPGQSKHNARGLDGVKPAARAYDCVPLRNGKPVWGTSGDGIDSNPADDQTDDLELWQRVGQVGEALGLEWAGRWPRPKCEFPHFQLKGI